MEFGQAVRVKDLEVDVVYNYFMDLSRLYNFIVISKSNDEVLYISGNDLTGISGVLLLSDTDSYYFVRRLTELEKVLL